jgi:hypothetical protein
MSSTTGPQKTPHTGQRNPMHNIIPLGKNTSVKLQANTKTSRKSSKISNQLQEEIIFNLRTSIGKLESLCKGIEANKSLQRVHALLENEFTSVLGYISECTRISKLCQIEGAIF